jgi:hypothetical protein
MSRMRLGFLAVALLVIPTGLVAAAPAGAVSTPQCRIIAGNYWPAVHSDLKDCSGGNPESDGVLDVMAALEGLYDLAAGRIMNEQDVHVFYFFDRADANEYFAHTLPYSAFPDFQTQTAKCGNTWYVPLPHLIAAAVYKHCTLAGDPKNANVQETALHEGGHAYDDALASQVANHRVAPSISKAFQAEVKADLTNDDATWTADAKSGQQAQWAYICSLFGIAEPNKLEVALAGKSAEVEGPVCQTTDQGMIPLTKWQNSSPEKIAEAKMPYFLGPNLPNGGFADVWAQGFALWTGRTGGPSLLTFTDYALPRVLWLCTWDVIGNYGQYGKPPVSYSPGCPVEKAQDYDER